LLDQRGRNVESTVAGLVGGPVENIRGHR
jgi:hypothetical protein